MDWIRRLEVTPTLVLPNRISGTRNTIHKGTNYTIEVDGQLYHVPTVKERKRDIWSAKLSVLPRFLTTYEVFICSLSMRVLTRSRRLSWIDEEQDEMIGTLPCN